MQTGNGEVQEIKKAKKGETAPVVRLMDGWIDGWTIPSLHPSGSLSARPGLADGEETCTVLAHQEQRFGALARM